MQVLSEPVNIQLALINHHLGNKRVCEYILCNFRGVLWKNYVAYIAKCILTATLLLKNSRYLKVAIN